MARVVTRSNETREVRFKNAKGKDCCLLLDDTTQSDSEAILWNIEHIVSRQLNGAEIEPSVAQWIAGLPDKLHADFVKHQLTQDRKAEESQVAWTLGPWTEKYISERPVKEATKRQLRSAARTLCEFFGDDHPIHTITTSDAANFRVWMETDGNQQGKQTRGLAKNTVRNKISRAKQIFKYAVKEGVITSNPFRMETSKVSKRKPKNTIACQLLNIAPYLLIGALVAAKYFGLLPDLSDDY
ncbi:MAG: hypothetical protein CMM01_03790 [Rhodopirellula sp.]|nr:hypothetical protein [Rhodopirellula sp.]